MHLEKLSPKEIAEQLKNPTGELGIAIGDFMNKGNESINNTTYNKLELQANDALLEIGMGNGKFIPHVLSLAENIQYTGLDFSKTMVAAALAFNKSFIQKGNVTIKEGSIANIPFKENSFDKICTINTLYFWPNPIENCKELLRVLKPKGKLIIAIRPKEILDAMEIAEFGFEKYTPENVKNLMEASGFKSVSYTIHEEPSFNFDKKSHQLKGSFIIGYK